MEKNELKAIIIELKDKGHSYQEISEYLLKNHGIKKSRQAIYGLYTRTLNYTNDENKKQIMLYTNDICHYVALGISKQRIKEILSDDNINISIGKINDISTKNSDYIENIKTSYINKLITVIRNGNDMRFIKLSLKYKNESITDKQLNILLDACSIIMIRERVIDELILIYSSTDNKQLIKDIIKRYNINTSLSEIIKQAVTKEKN